jgi:sporadic carbohydrate cluster 2OG-Fe(II) oxygenase
MILKNNYFYTDFEKKLSNNFISNGFVIFDSENQRSNDTIRRKLIQISSKILKKDIKLDTIHKHIEKKDINDFRLEVIKKINSFDQIREKYFDIGRHHLSTLAGNELVMQNNINLSIQLPKDETSVLPIHSDVWSGDSPYEINLWLPLVNCYRSKSMYILEQQNLEYFHQLCKSKKLNSSDSIYKSLRNKLKWINISYGKGLIFNQSLPHGNIVNLESTTRWSMNCRFKSIFSKYGDKKIGEFFSPITTRAMTKIAFDYKFPFTKN